MVVLLMAELEIIPCNESLSAETTAEFKVYSKIVDHGNNNYTGKIILEPVNNKNDNVNLFLTDKKYSGNILINLNRKPITVDNPVEIPLYYDKNEKSFYLEDNAIVDQVIIITGLICYDLGIGLYQARPDNYEINANYEEMQNPDNQFTDFIEIDSIILSIDELAKIKDYHVIYKVDYNTGATDVELIKYQRVTPKSATPESIKGIYDEADFENVELVKNGGVIDG